MQNFNSLGCLVLEISAFQYEACHGFRAGASVHKLFVGGVHPIENHGDMICVTKLEHIPLFYKYTVYPKKYAHVFCFAVLCCGYTLTDFPISIRLTSLALWQSNDCPSASKATLMNMDKYFMWIQYERLHNHNKAKHNKTVCIFLGIYCMIIYPCLDPDTLLVKGPLGPFY